jgi:PKD domain/Galactose oxidase, central domain
MHHPHLVRPLVGTLAALSLVVAGASPTLAADSITWTQQSPATSPAFRAYFGMAYDSARGRTVLFGGQLHGGTQSNETWEWDGTNWQLMQPANAPSPRNGFTMAYDSVRHVTVLFSGAYNTDTWEWDGVNWTQRNSAHTPLGRAFASMAFDSARGKMVLFGGAGFVNGTFTRLNDTWEWDGVDWTQASPSTSPVLRDNAAMAYDSARHVTVLFGGYSPSGYRLNDTWEWDGANWTQRTSTTTPPARWGHTMVYDAVRHASVIFGGAGDSGDLNDTWSWDGTNWTPASPTSAAPSVRSYHGMSFDAGRGVSVMFGGYSIGIGEFNDTWTGGFSAPAPAVTGKSFSAVEGASTAVTAATVSGGQAPLSASINWGDGTSSAGSVSGTSVTGTHAYAEEGSFAVTVTVTDARGLSASGTATASVSDAALAVSGINISADKKQQATRVVASFSDADPGAKSSDYAATINWGDGTGDQPGVVGTLNGVTFYVGGAHTYAARGTHTLTVKISDLGGFVASPVTSTATVS